MNLLLPLFIALSGFLAASALPVLDAPTRVCDYKAKGPLLALKREAAVKDFTRLYLVEKKPREAFDKWIPGYISSISMNNVPSSYQTLCHHIAANTSNTTPTHSLAVKLPSPTSSSSNKRPG